MTLSPLVLLWIAVFFTYAGFLGFFFLSCCGWCQYLPKYICMSNKMATSASSSSVPFSVSSLWSLCVCVDAHNVPLPFCCCCWAAVFHLASLCQSSYTYIHSLTLSPSPFFSHILMPVFPKMWRDWSIYTHIHNHPICINNSLIFCLLTLSLTHSHTLSLSSLLLLIRPCP